MQPVKTETILGYAERYRQIGLSIIPIRYGEKKPIGKWEEFQHRKLSRTEFENAFGTSKPVNIGVVCGEISGNLVSLDFDDLHNFQRFFPNRNLQDQTAIIQSSRGRHVWIRTTEPVKSFSVPELKLDVLGEGKLAIAPPSRHPSGAIYSFLNSNVIEPMHISDFQKAIIERCQTLHVRVPSTFTNSNGFQLTAGKTGTRILTQTQKDRMVKEIAPFWIRGHRHSMCIYLLGALIKAGVNQTTASELITRICDSTGDEEKRERLRQVAYHYKKPASALPKLKGLSGLRQVLNP
jgi:hypothetical protein